MISSKQIVGLCLKSKCFYCVFDVIIMKFLFLLLSTRRKKKKLPTLERVCKKKTKHLSEFYLVLCVKNTPLNYARDGMQISIDQVELIYFRFGRSIVCVSFQCYCSFCTNWLESVVPKCEYNEMAHRRFTFKHIARVSAAFHINNIQINNMRRKWLVLHLVSNIILVRRLLIVTFVCRCAVFLQSFAKRHLIEVKNKPVNLVRKRRNINSSFVSFFWLLSKLGKMTQLKT